jgi:hypothetical protein
MTFAGSIPPCPASQCGLSGPFPVRQTNQRLFRALVGYQAVSAVENGFFKSPWSMPFQRQSLLSNFPFPFLNTETRFACTETGLDSEMSGLESKAICCSPWR